MLLEAPRSPLRPADLPEPEPGPGQVLIQRARLRGLPHRPARRRRRASRSEAPARRRAPDRRDGRGRWRALRAAGARVGVPWLGWTDGTCRYCRSGRENLCEAARFTGYQLDGGYAERVVADERFCFPIPEGYEDLQAAPLLCAGLIGYRSLRMTGDAERLGLYGFGASAHIVAQVAKHQGRKRLRLYPSRRRRGPGVRALARRRLGRLVRRQRRPSRSMRRSSSPPSARSSRPPWPRPPGAASSSAPGST